MNIGRGVDGASGADEMSGGGQQKRRRKDEGDWTLYTGVEKFNGRNGDIRRVRVAPHVASIGEWAFNFCTELIEVDLCNVTRIEEGAFLRCLKLREVNLRDVTEIGLHAFSNCTSLVGVDLCDGLQRIAGDAFDSCHSLDHVSIPSSVAQIDRWAFAYCINLISVDVTKGLRAIDTGAFCHCRSLESIVIPSSVELIDRGAFVRCTSLASVELAGEGLLSLKHKPFRDCTSLERIQIPSPAFVITVGAEDNLVCQLSNDATVSPNALQMVVSKCVKRMSANQLVEAEEKINAILSRQEQTKDEMLEQIRVLFAYYELVEATTLLELAIWKANIDEGVGRDHESRQTRRRACGRGMNVIISGVLQYFNYRG